MTNSSRSTQDWSGTDGPLAQYIEAESSRTLDVYRTQPNRIREDANQERHTARGGYVSPQVFELVQNSADALARKSELSGRPERGCGLSAPPVGARPGEGRIEIMLTDTHLYCADAGHPISREGVTSLMFSRMSPKAAAGEIGRHGVGFKSVLGVSAAPEFFSRSGSFCFDGERAREDILAVAPETEAFPRLRIPYPIDPARHGADDSVLRRLMAWAGNIVRLPLISGARETLERQLREFPAEIMLLLDHVGLLSLDDRAGGHARRLQVLRHGADRVVLADGNRETRWQVFTRQHTLSRAAREDSVREHDAAECELRWAVRSDNTGSGSHGGQFWCYFPTNTASLVSGILNAPWKTNEDRQNLLPGPRNAELIEAFVRMIADHLSEFSTAADPARHLDILPRRREAGDTGLTNALRERLMSLLSDRPVLPDQEGKLRRPGDVRIPPKELAPGTDEHRDLLDAWSEGPGRPANWLHSDALKRHRLGKVAHLKSPAGTDLEHASVSAWLEALVDDRPDAELATASMHAVQLAARIPRSRFEPPHRQYGRIVLTADGKLRYAKPDELYLPDGDQDQTGACGAENPAVCVHGDLAADPATRKALKKLHIPELDPKVRFKRVADKAFSPYTAAPDRHEAWARCWEASREVAPEWAADVMCDLAKRDRPVHVMTRAGRWAPAHSVLLPGRIVGDGDGDDSAVVVDMEHHEADQEVLGLIGMVAEPAVCKVERLRNEPWYDQYLKDQREHYKASKELARIDGKPQWDYLVFQDDPDPCRPLNALPELSPKAAARYTEALLAADSTLHPWTMAHRTQPKYPPLHCESPVVWMLRRHGWIETSGGPLPLKRAFGREPDDAVLRALHRRPDAARIREAFGLKELKPDTRGESDPQMLADVWPGLRRHLPAHLRNAQLVRCDQLTTAGRERSCVAFGGDVYLSNQVPDGLEHLVPVLVAESLDLGLTFEQCSEIHYHKVQAEVQKRRDEIKQEPTDELRLLKAVGEDNLRAVLRADTLASLESDGRLSGEALASAFVAIHDTDALQVCRSYLKPLDPPHQWAGSGREVEFVKSLGLPEEWAGARKERRNEFEDVSGPVVLGPLHDYQETIAKQVRFLVRGDAHPNGDEHSNGARRGMISLPTGSGKTRIAVQALTEAIRDDDLDGPILWIADRDELCEQAVQSWKQVWAAQGIESKNLRVQRAWGGRPSPSRIASRHVVVASIQTLKARSQGNNPAYAVLRKILRSAAVVVVDEAHGSNAPSYTEILSRAGITWRKRAGEPCLIGLSATPYRGYDVEETRRLTSRYQRRLDHAAFASADPRSVVAELQRDSILAQAVHREIAGGRIRLTKEQQAEVQKNHWLPRDAEDQLAADKERTRRILSAYEKHVDPSWQTMIFATSVGHAEALAALLSKRGFAARPVSYETRQPTRRRIVEAFRNGEIRVLVNYALFKEGFDAPKVRAIMVARPVTSPNLYFQMIGRGLRGPKNGGTERCLILNVCDNIVNFDRDLAFTKLDWLWHGSKGNITL